MQVKTLREHCQSSMSDLLHQTEIYLTQKDKEGWNVLFNNALNTFYLECMTIDMWYRTTEQQKRKASATL